MFRQGLVEQFMAFVQLLRLIFLHSEDGQNMDSCYSVQQ